MSEKKDDIIAIDISKDTLEVKTPEECFSVPYSKRGLGQLHKRMNRFKDPFVVCEATGGYESILMDFLHEEGIKVCLMNPARIRAFAKSEGIKAKTDPIDTDVIYRFSQEKQLRATPAPDPLRKEIAILMDRRSQLKEQVASEKNRLQKCPQCMEKGIKRMIRFIDKELAEIEKMIRDIINSNDELKQYSDAMQVVKGVGEATAWSILAYLTEIGHLSRGEIAALVGLAPFNRDSGKWKGKRSIQGGRAKVRNCLFMAARTAAIHNDVIKPYTTGLIARGKSYKMAMVAAMRKILIHLQVIIRNLQMELAL
jgi:transposase